MNANEPRDRDDESRTEQLPVAGGGWSQFGSTPPTAGAYPGAGEQPAGAQGAQGAQGVQGAAHSQQGAQQAGEQQHTTPLASLPGPHGEPFAAAPAVPKQRRAFTAGQKVVAGLALAAMAIGGGAAGAAIATAAADERPAAVSSPVFKQAGSSLTVADVAQNVQPSVVTIQGQTGEGSGVVLSADGLILTNNHVVEGAGSTTMTVKFSDGKTAKATVVGTDPSTDIAVIKASDVSGLTPATLGDSDQLRVGDPVLAIGSPLGLEGSVSSGIVSALDRTLTVGGEQQQSPWGRQQQQNSATTIGGAIQTDAAINSGNSGGALVNAAGQVIGVNTAIATAGSNGNIGVGFAIPINTAKQVSDQLISSGKVSHAFLGVGVADATGGTAGALVSQVTPGSPAEKAGLKQGDIITKIGETSVDDGATVVGAVRGLKPGDVVKITYVRNGQPSEVDVTLTTKSE
ncbi:S1C family serine protease [Nonomuraea sp. NPDC050663]|uniref:S1C family serine protease n=1 Tax=Nonomuraea sp. NPDC050663 TaxID=3364370 RepID=UPI00378D0569